MTLHSLRDFVSIADGGSLRAAARDINYMQLAALPIAAHMAAFPHVGRALTG